MTKRKLIIFEGADGAGKTSSARLLCETLPQKYKLLRLSKKTWFQGLDRVPVKIKIDEPVSLTLYLEFLTLLTNEMDEFETLVLDRSIHSNLAYGTEDPELTKQAILWMNAQFDVRLVLLDRDYVQEDFKDDLLERSQSSFNGVIDYYRNYVGDEKIFRTRLIYDGVFDNLKQQILINTLMSAS